MNPGSNENVIVGCIAVQIQLLRLPGQVAFDMLQLSIDNHAVTSCRHQLMRHIAADTPHTAYNIVVFQLHDLVLHFLSPPNLVDIAFQNESRKGG